MESIRLLIVDNHPVVREGLRTMLSTNQTIEIVGEACGGAEAVAMVDEQKPNVVLTDIRTPNMDGIEATRRTKEWSGSTRISDIVFSVKLTLVLPWPISIIVFKLIESFWRKTP